uniref:Uncharacterized protein n=1 Tax=Siphoviridae sp. ctX5W26 TaxID=2825540 RepID=A0A8S5UEK8_9CAUD|nr:MAG TPA: hypothetical protein [Siphoviridae sp. ctX5W26]
MLVPKVKAKEFEKFGFKRCKGIPKELECYYLCIAKGCKMLFVSNSYFDVMNWNEDDTRIHKNANCRYRDRRTALDIIYELIKADMLKSEWE